MHWLPITLLSAFALASADALTKRWLGDWGRHELLLVRFGLSGLLLLPLLLANPWPALDTTQWLWLALMVPLELLAMHLYVLAIRDAPLSHTLPYMAFTPVFTGLFGLLVLGETVSPPALGGMLLVAAGAWWLNLEHALAGERLDLLAPLRAIGRERGARLMLSVALIYGITSVGSKAAMGDTPPFSFGALYFVLIGGATLLLHGVAAPRRLLTVASRPLAVLVIAGLMALMVVTHFTAVAEVEAAYMITVKRISLLFGMLYGAAWFGEQDLARNLAAGALMVMGMGLVLLAGNN